MPLKKGKSQAVISSNIGELMRSARAKGKKRSVQQAAAIAYKTAGRYRTGRG